MSSSWNRQRNRGNRITVPLDDDEKALLERVAADYEGGVSGFMRDAALAAAGTPAIDSVEAHAQAVAARVAALLKS